ncbi:MAG: hypothetical protein KGZ61_03955 [Sandarakinorhabdus sp.]|nr:hypothetical protein [Sandarakinorhabdus sp.]
MPATPTIRAGPDAGNRSAYAVVPALLALAMLAGCAARPPLEPPPPLSPPVPPGMERLIGQPAETALQLLGPVRLDRREGPARQLQFAGACILDIFYFSRDGQTPVATHAEARLPSGAASPPGDCLRALTRDRPQRR